MRTVTPDECIEALQRAGVYIARQKGSHVMMRRDEPPPGRTVPVPISKKPHRVARYALLSGKRD